MVKVGVSAIQKIVKPKPIKPILKNKNEATQILKDGQSIIDDINAGNKKPLKPIDVGYVEPVAEIEPVLVPKVKKTKVELPEPNKIKATEYGFRKIFNRRYAKGTFRLE